MEPSLYYVVKPAIIVQDFGANHSYYAARFKDRFGNPEQGHMGLDFRAPHATRGYAPCSGMAHYEKDAHGGEGIVINTGPSTYKGQPCTYNVILWHLIGDTDPVFPSPFPLDGKSYPVKAGDFICWTDNTGAPFESSGDHLHVGLIPFDMTGYPIEAHNGFNGCIDPRPYFNGRYAVDLQIIPLQQRVLALLRTLYSRLTGSSQ
ncbi:hypothetical protein [Bradyrhizobium sp. ORS 285]|uniref:hypothetical protein n=1 Tax=Bradyrhizobium sp. ORS 285 TaxID=115808 RepID=UPI0005508227|nr:hypothetical protein [Bradyrhizobium sp. ORS 285]